MCWSGLAAVLPFISFQTTTKADTEHSFAQTCERGVRLAGHYMKIAICWILGGSWTAAAHALHCSNLQISLVLVELPLFLVSCAVQWNIIALGWWSRLCENNEVKFCFSNCGCSTLLANFACTCLCRMTGGVWFLTVSLRNAIESLRSTCGSWRLVDRLLHQQQSMSLLTNLPWSAVSKKGDSCLDFIIPCFPTCCHTACLVFFSCICGVL